MPKKAMTFKLLNYYATSILLCTAQYNFIYGNTKVKIVFIFCSNGENFFIYATVLHLLDELLILYEEINPAIRELCMYQRRVGKNFDMEVGISSDNVL